MMWIGIAAAVYLLLVLTGWAMVLHFANERWYFAFIPFLGVYKRFRALEKLPDYSLKLRSGPLYDPDYYGEHRFYAFLIINILEYVYYALLLHVRVFWQLARKAGEGRLFAMGMVLCPPLFMGMLQRDRQICRECGSKRPA